MARRIWDTKCTQLFLVLIDGEFRYAQLKEIGLEECGEKYDHFLRRSRKKAKLTTDQLCAGDDKVKKWYTSHNWYLIYIVIINSILLLTDWLKRFCFSNLLFSRRMLVGETVGALCCISTRTTPGWSSASSLSGPPPVPGRCRAFTPRLPTTSRGSRKTLAWIETWQQLSMIDVKYKTIYVWNPTS